MSVLAVLEVASTATASGDTEAISAPTPAPLTMIGLPTVVIFGEEIDLVGEKVRYSFLVYQTYNAAGGATGMAQASGTSEWISIPQVCNSFPNVVITGTPSSAVIDGEVEFTIGAEVSYTETTPGLYEVEVAL